MLARDHFVDVLRDQQLPIYVKQAHPEDLQIALARALEFESFLQSTNYDVSLVPHRNIRVSRARAQESISPEKVREGRIEGACWGCGECSRGRVKSPGRPYTYEPSCWDCGQLDHLSKEYPNTGKTNQWGNVRRLDSGAESQPTPPRP